MKSPASAAKSSWKLEVQVRHFAAPNPLFPPRFRPPFQPAKTTSKSRFVLSFLAEKLASRMALRLSIFATSMQHRMASLFGVISARSSCRLEALILPPQLDASAANSAEKRENTGCQTLPETKASRTASKPRFPLPYQPKKVNTGFKGAIKEAKTPTT
ncbi:hypothetical protein BJ508DRAFT_333943 [Ascobolus immersus RN42]|uniref:Uncharacterized protein n=1 Tax=Ascobolus immersus RN42 TaxID=1160509 RepID=A0A3N4HM15_ASCIM|nr:hypothetical protein BJ508DRAFT_333943 [Ascobolus immersus RN42]